MASTVLKQKTSRSSKRQAATKRQVEVKRDEPQRVPTDDAVTIIHRRYIEGNPELEAYLIEERERLLLAGRIYDLRVNAGMSYAELAKKIGVPTSTIVRLEDTDYERHSLPLLRKIAAAFGMRLELNIVPMTKKEVRTTPPLKPHDRKVT